MEDEPSRKKEKSKGIIKVKKEGEERDIYFLIFYPRKQRENPDEFSFLENDINPQNIYTDEIDQENGTFYYKKVFKYNGKANKKYSLEFEIGKDNYIISFEVKENVFIYELGLKKGNKRIKNIAKEIIDQNSITYNQKIDIFLEALKKNNEKNKVETLYRDIIDLFEKKEGFSFLISLFVNIYKDKKLCPLLIGKFKEMNNRAIDNKNMDRNKDLAQYINNFKEISSEADNLIKNNDYETQHFYAIILCYLNYYDHDYFMKIFEKLFIEKKEDLYEILLIYFLHFLNPIQQNLDFFVKFIDYCASKKEYNIFENGLNYISDIETFITVLEKTKEKIVNKYLSNKSFKPIQLNDSLEFNKKEKNKDLEDIISVIESINNYSKEKEVLLVYFTSKVWKKILNIYNSPNKIKIIYCYKIRKVFFKYNDLVNELYKKKKINSEIKKDINKYFERDEFAFILDINIKKMIHNNNTELSNSEILGFVVEFNPYYKEDKYSYKKSTDIFDIINLDNNDEQFIDTFKKLEFVSIFKDNIIDFLNKMISKIKTISNLGTILDLIDIKKISKVDEFFTKLKAKYELVIKKQLDSLKDKELNNAVKIIAKFVDLIFIHENNCNFIKQKISKLDKKISCLIYIELIRRCNVDKYKQMKELIYNNFLNKLENINVIIDLIDSLEKHDKKIFMVKLIKKCQFTKEEYYSNNENEKIVLLCELYDKGKLKRIEDETYGEIEKIMLQISHDVLDGQS